MTRLLLRSAAPLLGVALAALAGPAAAQSVYAGVGSTGLTLGYAHNYSAMLGARAEFTTLPSTSRTYTQDNIDYGGNVTSRRVAALFDWHPMSGGFRLTAGLSAGNSKGEFFGAPSTGGTITIGTATVPYGPGDRYDVKAEFPSTMPYVGLGFGHAPVRGWGFHADLGVLLGKATVTGALSPSLAAKITATGGNPQAELDKELAKVRETTDKMIGVPVLSLGVSYRW
ncbi:MAG: hypothetical protein WCK28_14140 [Burkholderiales bacterium]|jgi:hypothetical protein